MKVLLVGDGYIGSYLSITNPLKGIELIIVDQKGYGSNRVIRYQDLTANDLKDFSAVLWFAGHSSVPSCIQDPYGSVRNNLTDLMDFAVRLPSACHLIYASSGSIYSDNMIDNQLSKHVNVYDAGKNALDDVLPHLKSNVTGLRMGTISGRSQRTRGELIFNAMNSSAINHGCVNVSNPEKSRSILFLSDLRLLILELLEMKSRPLIVDACSYSDTIGSIGERIASFYKVQLNIQDPSVTYDFRMNTMQMESLVGPLSDFEDQCELYKKEVEK
jgi:UDP-glucose 4-epimerase